MLRDWCFSSILDIAGGQEEPNGIHRTEYADLPKLIRGTAKRSEWPAHVLDGDLLSVLF